MFDIQYIGNTGSFSIINIVLISCSRTFQLVVINPGRDPFPKESLMGFQNSSFRFLSKIRSVVNITGTDGTFVSTVKDILMPAFT